MKFLYLDRDKIGVFKEGKTSFYESKYIEQYKENAKRMERNREWKKQTDAMMADGFYVGGEPIHTKIHSASFTTEENKIVYTLSVNELSRVCYKYLEDKEQTESNIVSSNEVTFLSFFMNEDGDAVGSVQTGEGKADIAVFSKESGDYKLVTNGDSLDENPFIDEGGRVIFNSYGVGRDEDNEFVTYVPSEILEYNLQSGELKTVLADGKYSFVKPMKDSEGNLYCIRKPGAEKERENIFLQILLIPVRIVEAIIGFVSVFVSIFAGKPLVSGKAMNGGGTRKRDKDPKEAFIHNQLVNVEREQKRNQKTADGGFIPREWKLLRYTKNEGDFDEEYTLAEELACGVADYCITEEDGKTVLLYTNGQKIFSLVKEEEKWTKKKLVNTDFCLKVSALYGKKKKDAFDDFFA